MGRRLRRGARRASLVAAGLCLLLAAFAPSSPAQEVDTVPRPDVFSGSASALVASVQVDRDALLPVPDLFKFIALDGESTYATSTRQARSSLLFPGNGLILGPSLACGTFGAQAPPQFKPLLDTCLQYKYPLTVFADDFEPDGATSGSLALGAPTDPISGNAVRAKAHAGEDATTTDAVLQDLRVLGLPGVGPVTPQISDFEMDRSLVTADSAVSRTSQRIVKGVLVVDTEATVSGLRMVGGLIRIGSLRSVSTITDNGTGTRTSTADLEMSGITVAGVPAKITEDGLVLGSPGGSGPLADQQQAAVNELLRALDVKVTLLPVEESTDGLKAVASVGGVLVEFARDVQGAPTVPIPNNELDLNGVYKGSIQIGSTAAAGLASTFPPDAELIDTFGPIDDSSGFGGGDFGPDVAAGGFDVAQPPVAGTPPAASTGGGGDESQQLARSLGDIFGGRLGLLYLSLMFAVLALCAAPGLTLPARLPGRTP